MNIYEGPAVSIKDNCDVVQEIEFRGIKINAGCKIVYGSTFGSAVGLFSLIDEPGLTFRILSNSPSNYSIQSLTTFDELRHRENNKPQFCTFVLTDSGWICDSEEYYYNDQRHRTNGPAEIVYDLTGEVSRKYWVHYINVSDDVIESGYEDGSAELEMLLSLMTPKKSKES